MSYGDPGDAEVLDRDAVGRAADRIARRIAIVKPTPPGSAGELLVGAGQCVAQLVRGPHVGAAGAGRLADGDQRPDLVVDPAGSEQVAGGVGVGVDDRDRRARIARPLVVAPRRVGQRQRLRVLLAGGDRVLQRGIAHASSSSRLNGLAAICRVNGVARQREPGRLDPSSSVNSCSTRSAAQISPPGLPRRSTIRPCWGSSSEQPDDLGDERVVVVDVERPDPQVAGGSAERLARPATSCSGVSIHSPTLRLGAALGAGGGAAAPDRQPRAWSSTAASWPAGPPQRPGPRPS